MKDHLKIRFHDSNDKEKTAAYLCDLIVDMLLEKTDENPKIFFEIASSIVEGEKFENSSLL